MRNAWTSAALNGKESRFRTASKRRSSIQPRGKRLLQPFYYHGVELGAGLLRNQVDEVRQFYLAIPDDDLLKGFRTRAGLAAPGKDLGGWYSSDTFHVFVCRPFHFSMVSLS